MIRRLQLRGWKAFDALDLELQDGVTFIVARNGVGKTSVIQAAAWATFGRLSGIDPLAARRVGHTETRASVDITLPDGALLILDRRFGDAETTHHSLDGATISDGEALELLATALGAAPEFLSRVTILPSSLIADDSAGSGYLRDHLASVFGVAQLEHAARLLDEVRERASQEAAKYRKSSRTAARDAQTLTQELKIAEQHENTALQSREQAEQRAKVAESRLAELTQHAVDSRRAEEAAAAYERFVQDVPRQIGDRFASLYDQPDRLFGAIRELEAATTDAIVRHREAVASLSGRMEGITSAAHRFEAATAVCPVCRRAMSEEVFTTARQAHADELATLEEERRRLTDGLHDAQTVKEHVSALLATAPPLPLPPSAAAPSEQEMQAAADDQRDSRERLMSVVEALGAARATRTQVARQLEELAQQEHDDAASLRAHKREAAATLAAETMRSTAATVLAERIDPLVTEVRNRWKKVHADRGALTLLPDGQIVLMHGEYLVEFPQFSSGEKVIALLEARMLVLAASTRASFLWLDEPMEHLDPISRRSVASMLATGAADRNIRQIIVTTYEEELARTFEASEDARVIWVDAQPGG